MNKPIAWTDGRGNYFDKHSFFPVDDLIPLYTHPVKEITDEEIEECYCNTIYQGDFDKKVFARAILRKASEK